MCGCVVVGVGVVCGRVGARVCVWVWVRLFFFFKKSFSLLHHKFKKVQKVYKKVSKASFKKNRAEFSV